MTDHPLRLIGVLRAIGILTVLVTIASCSDRRAAAPAQNAMPEVPHDAHSYAVPQSARVTHVSLNLTPDFETHKLSGTATLSITRAPNARQVVLDTRDLTIRRVTDGRGATLTFEVGPAKAFLGSPLTITLPEAGNTLAIEYETAPSAAAVQWLAPVQTAGKKLPFLFTQGEAILTRSWVPTQDSPGIR